MADNTGPKRVDTLVYARWIVPVNPGGVVLENHAVAVSEGRIEAIIPATEAERGYQADQSVELGDHILLPGLINAHGHAAMSLLRGYADDTPLITWLNDHIWPAEARHVSPAFVEDGTRLAIAEMVRGGTTCFSDMYFFPDLTARLAQEAGMRAQIAFPIFDFPTIWGSGPDEYIAKGLDLRDQYQHSDLIDPVFGPHAPYTVSEAVLARVATLAAELDCNAHIHVQETAGEVTDSIEQHGVRPLALLDRSGLLGPRTQCVHMTQVNEEDLALLSKHRAPVVHCPSSNMKLASGACPVSKLLAEDVIVALGTDSAASNNRLDMFEEMRGAALLAKLVSEDASAVPAAQALAMATINGARALGIEEDTGSLEVGKSADMIAVDTRVPGAQPVFDPVSQLVYATQSSQVTHSWVAGHALMLEGELTGLQSSHIMAAASSWAERIANDSN